MKDTDIFVFCSGCGKRVGKLVLSWTDPPEMDMFDTNCENNFPEEVLCGTCKEARDVTKNGL